MVLVCTICMVMLKNGAWIGTGHIKKSRLKIQEVMHQEIIKLREEEATIIL
ncbi:hypothetical protein D3C87_1738320 [compost metagenome]